MPPKRAAPLAPVFLSPGSSRQPPPAKKQQKQAKAAIQLPLKSSFFSSGSRLESPAAPPQFSKQHMPFVPRRSFLYDRFTEEPYAEWIGNEAVCLETGEVLFVSRRGEDEFSFGEPYYNYQSAPETVKFDFTPPTHKHPKDPSISSQDLIDKGILTLDDFLTGNAALSVEAHRKYMELVAMSERQ